MPNNQLCESPVNQTNLSKKPSKRRLRWIIFILVIIVLLLVIFLRGKKQTQEAAQTQTAKNITTLRIGDESTRYALLEKTLKVTSRDEAKIYAQYSGRIQQVNFKAGDKVAAGQILASFDQSSRENTTVTDLDLARSSVQYAEDNLDSVQDSSQKDIKIAKNNVEIAKIALEKIKSDQDSTSQDIKTAEETLEQAKRQRDKTEIQAEQQEKTAKNSLDSARANLEKAAAVHGRTIITAPISGVIS
ncbi:biotin/lipoyl-binding protein, partial [Patescibacteria group bacterium]|nr:biotin/lipoyl-binding protein [Patescibacteria group bacterium]